MRYATTRPKIYNSGCATPRRFSSQTTAPVADLTKIGDLEPDEGDRPETGWTDREEAPE